ncbi:hypothetical protein [Aureimonas leprariae]|uniref:Uncharacterized protein n=1 Tax=Plantimonas leprariae TaxID=2615207 RepID=A0A7V7PMA9_9HYPH|nr:hypothetical protein [Aureimonas leprariae]KAB0678038.1 hypothetical protein F6X38_16560 [Aureimonas leprariae]
MQNVPNGPTGEAMSDPRSILIDTPAAERARIAADPMLTLIRAYEAERAAYNASEDKDDERAGAHFFWLHDRLKHHTPPIYTAEGAIAALRLAADSLENEFGGFQEALVAAALAFLRTGRA